MSRNKFFIFFIISFITSQYTFPQDNSLQNDFFTIKGLIVDEKSKENLIGVNVIDRLSQRGISTNEYGFYSITLPKGRVSLRFTYVGYESIEKEFDLRENISINILLSSNSELNEIVIYGTNTSRNAIGAIDIPFSMINATPTVLGEKDVMKTIQLLPGVQSGAQGSSGIYVRGGGADENLFLLDGVPLYNVDHLYGFFSTFTADAIKKVSFYKGGFPARFNGRLSSVVDVRTNDGDMENYHGTLGIGLLSSKFQLEGPIIKNKTSFNIAARRSYLDLIAKPFMDKNDNLAYYFYDINAKINHKFSDKSRLYLSFYNGKDKMNSTFKEDNINYDSNETTNIRWGNLMNAVRWNYIFSPKLFFNTTLAYTKYGLKVNTHLFENNYIENSTDRYLSEYKSGIDDLSFNIDFDYYPKPEHQIKFGFGYIYHTFKPETLTSYINQENNGVSNPDITYESLSNSDNIKVPEIKAYIEDNIEINKKLNFNIGVNLSLFKTDNTHYYSIQPRFLMRYMINKNFAIEGSFTQMDQYIHLLSSYSISMPTDLWVPATDKIKPMKAYQYSMAGHYFGKKGWQLSLEAYYKTLRNVLEYKDGASFIGSSYNWVDKVEAGRGRAMGLEFMLQKSFSKLTGSLSYTLAKSDRKFSVEGINNGSWFPYKYDRRHNLNLSSTYKFSEKIDIYASWEFYTGGAITLAEEQFLLIRPDGQNYLNQSDLGGYIDSRNNFRLPSSHCLNIGINFNKKMKHGIRTWNISLYNAYNAMNPTFIYRDIKNDPGDSDKVILKKVTILPLLPSVSYIYKF